MLSFLKGLITPPRLEPRRPKDRFRNAILPSAQPKDVLTAKRNPKPFGKKDVNVTKRTSKGR